MTYDLAGRLLTVIMLAVVILGVINLGVIMLGVVMLGVVMLNAECRYAECRYFECRYAECRGDIPNTNETAPCLTDSNRRSGQQRASRENMASTQSNADIETSPTTSTTFFVATARLMTAQLVTVS